MVAEDLIGQGRAALAEGRWKEASALFEAVLQAGPNPDALLGLGEAQWWMGAARRAVECIELAYAELRRNGNQMDAVMAAIQLSLIYNWDFGNNVAASGWVARAARTLGDMAPDSPLLGWVLLARAVIDQSEPVRSKELATRALQIARAHGDYDLELCALSGLGEVLVGMGHVREGFALVDEAMAGTFGGEPERLDTVVFTSCTMLTVCEMVADLERATHWSSAAERFVRTYGSPYLHSRCRIGYGSVLLATGQWADAERELLAAAQVARDASRAMYGLALARLAVLRVRQGRLEEAEGLASDVDDDVWGALPAAMVELARGHATVAITLLQRRLNGLPVPHGVDAAETWELLVEARAALGDVEGADAAAAALSAIAERSENQVIQARAARATALVAAMKGDQEAAMSGLERALEGFSRIHLPWEAARARLELARASMESDPALAIAEGRRALAAFDQLGATPGSDQAAALLRALGVAGRTGPRDIGVLTQREQEVLRLMGAGLSNPEIAERLVISRKTAAHHVSNILAKLGVRNRAEAVAWAAKASLPPG